jgi:CDP-diacylglycerol--glycerol-3-phosphate 3-phosphatidyltransferase
MAEPETSPWNLPNALTAFRIVLVPIFAWMLLAHPQQPWWRFGTAVIFSVAILTDTLDGYLARKHNIITRFGKLADPIADKALTGMAFIGLSIIDELPWWVTITILVREWGITIMRFVVLRYGVMAAGRGGKVKTVTQAIAVIMYLASAARSSPRGRDDRDGCRLGNHDGNRPGLRPGSISATTTGPSQVKNAELAESILAELSGPRRDARQR